MIDENIIRKAQDGNDECFTLLMQHCEAKAYNICFRYMKEEQDALDALQESFFKLYRNLSSFKFNSTFETWFFRIVVNTCNDILRKNVKRKTTDSLNRDVNGEISEIELIDKGDTPEEAYIKTELKNKLLDCIDLLPADQKAVIILRDIQGFSYEEISEITLSNAGTVKSRLNRGRKKLKDIYVNGTNP